MDWWTGGGAFDGVWRAGLCNQDLTLVLQEDAPRVIFACVCASEGMDRLAVHSVWLGVVWWGGSNTNPATPAASRM